MNPMPATQSFLNGTHVNSLFQASKNGLRGYFGSLFFPNGRADAIPDPQKLVAPTATLVACNTVAALVLPEAATLVTPASNGQLLTGSVGCWIYNTHATLIEKRETLGKKLGPQITKIAKALQKTKFETPLRNQIDQIEGKDPIKEPLFHLYKNLIETGIVYPEVAFLQEVDNLQTIIEGTSPKKVLAKFYLIPNFLKVYREALEKRSHRSFSTQEAETLYWKEEMGPFWHPIFNDASQSSVQQKEKLLSWAEATYKKLETLLFPERIVSPAIPGVQEASFFGIGEALRAFFEQNKEMIRKVLYAIDDRQVLYQTLQTTLRQWIATTLPATPPTAQEHEFLVEKIGGKTIIAWCSPKAMSAGIGPGMVGENGKILWDAVYGGTQPAIFLTDFKTFGSNLPLGELIRRVIVAGLQSPDNFIKSKIDDIKKIPYLGPIAALLLIAVHWGIELLLHGLKFVIGFPTIKTLSDEFSTNFLLHLFNPALKSAPLILIDNLLEMFLSAQQGNLSEDLADRDAVIGDSVIELTKVFLTLFPSITNLQKNTILKLSFSTFVWTLSKGAGLCLLTVANPVSRTAFALGSKVLLTKKKQHQILPVSTTTFEWLQTAAYALICNQSFVPTTHAILSKSFESLALFGHVSKNQAHFLEGKKSLAHLIHHTALALLRPFVKNPVSYLALKEKIKRNEQVEDGDVVDLIQYCQKKQSEADSEEKFASELFEKVSSVKPCMDRFWVWLQDPKISAASFIGQCENRLIFFEQHIHSVIKTQQERTGTTSIMAQTLADDIDAVKKEFSILKQQPKDTFDPRFFEDLANTITRQDSLRKLFIEIVKTKKEKAAQRKNDCQLFMNNRHDPKLVTHWIKEAEEAFYEQNFSDGFEKKLGALVDMQKSLYKKLEENRKKIEEKRQRACENPKILELLQRKKRSVQIAPALIQKEKSWVQWFRDWQQMQPMTLKDEILIYFPSLLDELLKERAAILSRLLDVEESLSQNTQGSCYAPAIKDPIWWLEKEGKDLVPHLKNLVYKPLLDIVKN
jgi:hypothetical protein